MILPLALWLKIKLAALVAWNKVTLAGSAGLSLPTPDSSAVKVPTFPFESVVSLTSNSLLSSVIRTMDSASSGCTNKKLS
jgi:hypothetical protein